MGDDLKRFAKGSNVKAVSMNNHNKPEVTSTAIDIAVVKAYQDQFGEDGPEMMSLFIELFFEYAPEVLAEMQQAIVQSDAQAISRAAHNLRGNGVTFGAICFTELCYQLEKHAKSGSLQGVEEMANGIQQEFNRCKQELSRYLETLQVINQQR